MGKILAVCVSSEKGTPKRDIGSVELIAGHGLSGDAHSGQWHRQVSLLSYEKIEDFREKGAKVEYGDFGENIVADNIDLKNLPVGTFLECGNKEKSAVLEITQIGKECHIRCAIYNVMGDCIMPREGVFARVTRGGIINAGDEINIRGEALYRVWLITASDKGFAGEREDKSSRIIREVIMPKQYNEKSVYIEAGYTLLSDDQTALENEMKRVCDNSLADLILTTGGTGFSPRDRVPEATIAAAHRLVPGIAEAMRAAGMNITKRAMLSRAAAAIRERTLIVNLPGSPKAARENLEFIIDDLKHGLDILTGHDSECAR
ncbi:MAG: molybdopterin-binding protein [Treponema sp.]|nr:molybdopterin-binding protein [Treponema sp.]